MSKLPSGKTWADTVTAQKEPATHSPPRGSNSQPSDALASSLKSLTLYPIELGGHIISKYIGNLGFGAVAIMVDQSVKHQ